MALTRLQMVTEICDIVGKRAGAASVSGAVLSDRVVNYLNFAQRRIARAVNFDELNTTNETATTVAGVYKYPLSAGTNNLALVRFKDFMNVKLIDSENSRILPRWNYRTLDKKYPYPDNYAQQKPTIYSRWGNDMILFRIPDAAYTLYIKYSQWPNELTSNSQVSDFLQKDELLIAGGCLETYLALQEAGDAAVWKVRFDELLEKARIDDDYEPDWEPEGEPSTNNKGPESGTPWIDPMGTPGDPLYGYAG